MRQPDRSLLAVWLLVALLAVVAAGLPGVALADPLDDRTRQVGRQIMCPVCEGQSVADSNSGLARDMRALIRDRLAAGDSEQAILERFVASYGEGILVDPPKRGTTLGVWIAPVVVTVLGIAIAGLVLSGWLRRGSVAPVPAGAAAEASAAEEFRRYREQLGR